MLIRLHSVLAAVCPIDGVAGEQGNVRIDFATAATDQQRQAAQDAVAAFDWTQAAQDAWQQDQKPERKTLRAAAAQAIADNDAFLAITSPTNAQTLAQVKSLTRQMNRLIPFVAKLD